MLTKTSEKPKWIRDAIFYQIFPDRFYNGNLKNDPKNKVSWGSPPTRNNFFGGDLVGIKEKIPYLKKLGVNAIYLNPIFEAGTNHKYDTWDYYNIDPLFGNEKSLRSLLREAHKLNIRIILDGVFNHCGDGFWAFKDVKTKGINSKYFNWFKIYGDKISLNPLNYQTAGNTKYLPKLNHEDPLVEEYILQVAEYWSKKFKIDGWRLDTPWKVKRSFWKKFRLRIKQINPELYLVGEVWHDAQPWILGDTFDGVMNYRLREQIINFFIKDRMDAEDFNYEIAHFLKIYNKNAYSLLNLISSHDTPRILTMARKNISKLILAITFLMTYIGAPMIYYGDEIGIEGGDDPDCRRTMVWDENLWNKRIYYTYKKLIDFRLKHKALRRGNFKPILTLNKLYTYIRKDEDDEVIVILNVAEKQIGIKLPLKEISSPNKNWKDIFTGKKFKVFNNNLIIDEIPACSSFVLESDG